MPTVLIFAVGTLAWLILLLIWGVRHLMGHSVDGQVPAVATAGVLLGVGGMLWGWSRKVRQATPVQQPAAGTDEETGGKEPGRAGTSEDLRRAGSSKDRGHAPSGEDRVEPAAEDGYRPGSEATPTQGPLPEPGGGTDARRNTEESP